MKRLLQINPNFQATTSQKIASALAGISTAIYEAAPDYVKTSDLTLFNRATGVWVQTTVPQRIGTAKWTSAPKGAGYIYRNDPVSSHIYEPAIANLSEFTIVFVGQRNIDASATSFIAPFASGLDPAHYVPNLVMDTAGNLKIYKNTTTSTVRLSAAVSTPNNAHIYTMTYSATDGLKLYIDGTVAAENKVDKNNLNDGTVRLPASGTIGFGHLIVSDVDMSKTQYQANLKSLHDTLIQHYAL